MKAVCRNKQTVSLWVVIVYALSWICYVPAGLKQQGAAIPNGLLLLKYGFVCVPAVTAMAFLLWERGIKGYFVRSLSGKIRIQHLLIWVLFALEGIAITACYSRIAGTEVFQAAYPSFAALIANSLYLLMTAFAEEIAWRGFLLERLPFKKGISRILFAGAIWTGWHLPMWIIRNALGMRQILLLCIWTLLVSVVLGTAYCQCRNLLFAALLHAAFNICFLAPIPYSIALLALTIAMAAVLVNKHQGRPPLSV